MLTDTSERGLETLIVESMIHEAGTVGTTVPREETVGDSQ